VKKALGFILSTAKTKKHNITKQKNSPLWQDFRGSSGKRSLTRMVGERDKRVALLAPPTQALGGESSSFA
jgi:hypothetical protein